MKAVFKSLAILKSARHPHRHQYQTCIHCQLHHRWLLHRYHHCRLLAYSRNLRPCQNSHRDPCSSVQPSCTDSVWWCTFPWHICTRSPSLGASNYPGVFTDLSIFSLNLPRIQTPTGTTVTNHKRGLGSLIDVGIFTGRLKGKAAIVSLTDARSCRTELTYFAGKEV